MSDANIFHLEELPQRVGGVLGISQWIVIDQAKIDAFAGATGDRQWIHVDSARAAASPFGTTIAHGFLTLSLLPLLSSTAFTIVNVGTAINYGLNRVRFPAPVPVGSRVRGRFELLACETLAGGMQLTIKATIEREGSDRPVCVAETLSRRFASVSTDAK
ncbi:MAG TPA: MaoC family dehydratase [Burkholderiaceae bacterium]|nr:MaoC family dehydratase [Burkholderiaceae bacterium]